MEPDARVGKARHSFKQSQNKKIKLLVLRSVKKLVASVF